MMNKKLFIASLSVMLLFLATFDGSIIVSADDWFMFHHDARHTGYSTSKSPNTNNIMWNSTIGSISRSSPAFGKGRLYIGSKDGNLYCFDAEPWGDEDPDEGIDDPENANYDLIWTFTAGDSILSSPVYHDDKIYFGSNDGKIYCIYACIGTEIWTYPTGGPVHSSPTLVSGKIYVGSDDGKVYCLNASDGLNLWQYQTSSSSPIFSSPAVNDNMVYFGSNDGHVYCLYASNGTEIWKYATSGSVLSSPAIAYEKIYVGSNDNKIYCLNTSNGVEVWNYSTGDAVLSSPAIAEDKVYIGSNDGKLYCLNASNGLEMWNYSTGGLITSSPAILDMRVYVGSENGNIYCFRDHNPPVISESPIGPASGIARLEYTFLGNAVDPEDDTIYYMFDWGDGKNSSWIGPYNSGYIGNSTHKWSKEGDYEVRVKAKDSYGYESDWSDPSIIHIGAIEIRSIRGGLGIHAEIRNNGRTKLWQLSWNISIDGGLIQNPANRLTEGRVQSLEPDESEKIWSGFVFELGRIDINISVKDLDGKNAVTEIFEGYAFGCIIIISDCS